MSDRYKGAILSPTAPTVTPQSAGGIYTSSQQLQYQGQGVWPQAVNYPINNSLRFRKSASAYLNRTPTSAGNQKTFTFSTWLKRGGISSDHSFFTSGNAAPNPRASFEFTTSDTLYISFNNGSGWVALTTSAVYRDPSAWYHIVVAVDTTQATSTNRVKLYVNGSQVTAFSSATYPNQNDNTSFNDTVPHSIGSYIPSPSQYLDGYLGEVNFIDGVALTPSSFGTTDAYGIWQPIPYTGAYGTNGFYLPFNPGSTVSASYLVVAGGGGGGNNGAGGGAGGLLTGSTTIASTASYTVTVGAGGAGSSNNSAIGSSGGTSSFSSISATGGGGGASGLSATGGSGGSGGGGWNGSGGGSGTSGQGFAGGTGAGSSGGGGGGAGAVGANASGGTPGAGGIGIASSISGTSTYYGGGGGSLGLSTAGSAGGLGGGGTGASHPGGTPVAGTANTGGGGGGGSTAGASGGSGVVIISYPGSARFTGGTVTTSGGNTIHTFTSSGTLAAITNISADASGNGNNWTPNNISLTPGSTYDSMIDVPTNTNSNTANYATLNPLNTGGGTYSNGNLQWVSPATDLKSAQSTVALNTASTGKWYWEVTCVSKTGTNYQVMLTASSTSYNTNPWLQYRSSDGVVTINGSSAGTFSTFTTGDVIGVTFDASNSQVALYKNNTLVTTQTISNTSNTYIYAALGSDSSGGTMTYAINFGQQPFSYTPPTGFLPLNTYNLPTPTILAGIGYMGATIYSGDSTSNRVITTGGGSDFVWIKRRNSSTNNILFDVIRGAGATLYSNLTTTEAANGTYYVQVFGNTSFTLGTGGDAADNITGGTYVAWNWKANGAGVSNTQGTITSTISVNTTAGFSVVTYTGNGTSGATVGHGLGVAPSMVIVKRRNGVASWIVNHTSAGTGFLLLENTAAYSSATTYWTTAPTSSLLPTLTSNSEVNASGGTYVAYCFAAVAGYSAFGSYTGNGSADGPFIFTGFRPRYVMIKRTDAAQSWWITDTARNTYNTCNLDLFANLSNAEENNGYNLDLLSNGVKIRTSTNDRNASGGTYIYMAFAENPFKISRAR